MKIRDVMTEQIVKAQPDTTLEEIAMMMKTENTGAIPVVDEDELIGIVTDRDIVVRCIADGGDPTEVTAEDIVSEDLETIDPDAEIDEAMELMSQKQIRRLPVVNTAGELVGMVSIGDLAAKQEDEEESGHTLKNVSRGVKNSRRVQSQPVGRAGTAMRQAAEKGGSSGQQGVVSKHSATKEVGRQSRVIPFRSDPNQAARGQKKSSKHKAS